MKKIQELWCDVFQPLLDHLRSTWVEAHRHLCCLSRGQFTKLDVGCSSYSRSVFLLPWSLKLSLHIVLCINMNICVFFQPVYKKLLPLYYPRSEEEEMACLPFIPADIGNSEGEPVVPERQIRITEKPGTLEGTQYQHLFIYIYIYNVIRCCPNMCFTFMSAVYL